jgi:hypothetical protein
MNSQIKPTVSFAIRMVLTEEEARALDAIVGYGDKAFLEAFYEKMGKAYLQPHEKGYLSLASSIREQLVPQLHDIDVAWEKIKELK